MNRVASKVKSSLTCSNCSKIFKNPVELPCKHNICEEHLIEKTAVNQNRIQCVKCKQEFELINNDFKSIQFIQDQIDNKIYFSDEEINLKQRIEDSITSIHQMYEQFTLSKNTLDLDCHNHFQEIRFQIDEHREKLKKKIDDISMEMIDKTKEFEAFYLNNLTKKLDVTLKLFKTKSINEELNEIEETFRNPNLLIESIQDMQFKQEEVLLTIKLNLEEMNKVKDILKVSNEFKPNLTFNNYSFGQLNLKQHSISNSSLSNRPSSIMPENAKSSTKLQNHFGDITFKPFGVSSASIKGLSIGVSSSSLVSSSSEPFKFKFV